MKLTKKQELQVKISVFEDRIHNLETRIRNYKLDIKNLEGAKVEIEKDLFAINYISNIDVEGLR